jgi:hypothetical protein
MDAVTAEALITSWLDVQRADNPVIAAIERGTVEGADVARWYVRMQGEEKEFITLWLTLRERTLHFETYVAPAPEENAAQFYEYLLRANQRLYVMRFAIGPEDAVYLMGQLPLQALCDDELDRLLGSTWQHAEECFPTAMRIGYSSRFRR